MIFNNLSLLTTPISSTKISHICFFVHFASQSLCNAIAFSNCSQSIKLFATRSSPVFIENSG
ncbi:TPA: hypothetical protein DEG21_04885 [Patescibacteria group bacterium]|nr:hypothetical protein [Candidatus Gracilibacteria bacterium]HBY75166.1 hypothetical protein [Candidatus Gracilibacteria bacterium]